jgi:hypothetical protein
VGWFSGWGGRSAPPALELPAGHRSLALKGLLATLRPSARRAVLDLGPALGSNIEFLSALHCRVRVLDLHHSVIGETLERREPKKFEALLERLVPLAPGEAFDAVLAWDVLNYLRRDQVSSLMRRLARACHAGAPVLAFFWTRRQMPLVPLRYRIADHENVAWEGPRDAARPSPRYSANDVVRMTPGFAVKGSFLLRNGIQEYLLENVAGS